MASPPNAETGPSNSRSVAQQNNGLKPAETGPARPSKASQESDRTSSTTPVPERKQSSENSTRAPDAEPRARLAIEMVLRDGSDETLAGQILRALAENYTAANLKARNSFAPDVHGIALDELGVSNAEKEKDKEKEKENATPVRVLQVGTPAADDHSEKVVAFVGPARAGKTSLLNALINHLFGVQFDSQFRLRLCELHDGRPSPPAAQWLTALRLNWSLAFPLPYTLTLVDTPPINAATAAQLRILLAAKALHAPDHIDLLCIVLPASADSVPESTLNAVRDVQALLGTEASNATVLMATHADNTAPRVANALQGVPVARCLKANTSALLQAPTDDEEEAELARALWGLTERSMRRLFHLAASSRHPSTVQPPVDPLAETQALEASIEELQATIKSDLSEMDVVEREGRAMEEHRADIDAERDFAFSLRLVRTRRREVSAPKGHFLTYCLVCAFECHADCAYPNDQQKVNCWAMGRDHFCRMCPHHCYWDRHVNTRYFVEFYEEEVMRSLQHLKDKYKEHPLQNGESNGEVPKSDSAPDSSHAEEPSVATLFERMTQSQRLAYETLQKHVAKQLEAVRARLESLGARGKKPSPLSFVEFVDALVESESRAQQPGWSDRVRKLQRTRTDAVLVSTLDDLAAKTVATAATASNAHDATVANHASTTPDTTVAIHATNTANSNALQTPASTTARLHSQVASTSAK